MSRPTSLLVLGLGNVLLADDGIGAVAVAQLLERYEPGEGVRVLDGGTLGLSLLPYLEDADAVILVDAVQADQPPGSIVRLDGDQVIPAVATRLSPHQVGVADLLDGARWLERYPAHVVLLGIVPEAIDLGIRLSPAIERHVPALVECIVDQAARFGFELRRIPSRETNETSGAMGVVDVDRLAWLR